MRKLISLLLLLCMTSLYSKAQEPPCPNPGQVFRTSCPTETLIDCLYDDRPCAAIIDGSSMGGVEEIYKWEKKRIGWAHSSEDIVLRGFGFCSEIEDCNYNSEYKQFWPAFMPPVVSSSVWRQDVITQRGTCYYESCGFLQSPHWVCSIDQTTTPFISEGSCATVGGGGGDDGGGDSEPGGGGGCVGCGCYYQTVYTYTPTGAGECYHVYQREEYMCGDQVQWQSPDQYIHTCCICEELQ